MYFLIKYLIRKWREKQAFEKTRRNRPDLPGR